MRLNPRFTSAFMLAALLVWTVPARADPITAVYDVQVLERTFGHGGAFGSEEFHRQFTLSMTFDPANGTSTSTYGPVSFSSVPLPIPSPPADLVFSGGSGTTHLGSPDFFARATAGTFGAREVAGIDTIYSVDLQLSGSVEGSQALLSPETFPIHLGTLGSLQTFNFFYSSCLGIGPFPPSADSCTDAQTGGSSHVTYFGRATMSDSDAPPIPEPATVVLVGSGLVIAARCKQRRRERNRQPR